MSAAQAETVNTITDTVRVVFDTATGCTEACDDVDLSAFVDVMHVLQAVEVAYDSYDFVRVSTLCSALLTRGLDTTGSSLFWLGVLHMSGEGLDKDLVKAEQLFAKAYPLLCAREESDHIAQTNLGWMYSHAGDVVRMVIRDYKKAVSLYASAASKGFSRAQVNLARMYQEGEGVPIDLVKAFSLLRQASSAGSACATYYLASAYYHGDGVTENKLEAIRLYKLAASKGDALAQYELAWMYFYGNAGADVTEDKKKAIELYHTSAEKGHTSAQNNLGWLYAKGSGVEQDRSKAHAYYKLATKKGNPSAQYDVHCCCTDNRRYNLACMYNEDDELEKAVKFYKLSAENGNVRAQYCLACLTYSGGGVKQDKQEAIRLWHIIAEQEQVRGPGQGRGVPGAVATSPAVQAQYDLALVYLREDTYKDATQAVKLLTRASNSGHELSKHRLRQLLSTRLNIEHLSC